MYIEQKKAAMNLINKAKTDYYTDKVLECETDKKAPFMVINSIHGWNKTAALHTISTLADAAEEFLDFFFS